MNYLQSNNNRYRHHFCIFAKYRINMKREILYQKIAGTIAWQIKTGIWKAGEKLPSLRTISNEYGVSLNTAIQVYYELEKEGFIISRPKSGYIVNYKPLNLSAPATTQPSAQSPGKEEGRLNHGSISFHRRPRPSPVSHWEYRKMFYCLSKAQ